jgi:hypothetical protein
MDYDDDPEGMVRIERVEPFEMYADPNARKKNLGDARELMRVREITPDQFEALFPGREVPSVNDALGVWGIDDEEREDEAGNPLNDYRKDNRAPQKAGKIRLAEYQWRMSETVYRMADPASGKVVTLPEDRFSRIDAAATQAGQVLTEGMDYVKARQPKICRAFIVGGEVIEYGKLDVPGFTYRAITAKRDVTERTWYGVVRAMKDPQRWANKWLSQILHIINSNAKGGILAEASAIDDPRKFQETWAKTDSLNLVADGALARGAIQPKPPITYPAGLDKLMEFAISSIRDVSGVSLELLGMVEKDQPGVLEAQRKQAGLTILAGLFDALRRYRKEQGRLLLHYITNYMSDGRLIRITGQNGINQYVPLVRQPDTLQYDVIVDDAPTAPNQKEAVWGMLVQLGPVLMQTQLPPGVWAELLKFSPLPESVSNQIAQAMSAPPPPEAVQAQQLQMAAQQADVEKKRADAMLATAKAQQIMADPMAEVNLQREKIAGELQVRREEMFATADLKREQMAMDGQIKAEGQRMQAEAASKPATVVQFDAQDAMTRAASTLEGMAQQQGTALAQAMAALNDTLGRNTDVQAQSGQMQAEALKMLAQAMMAETEAVRGPDGRVVGARKRVTVN